MTFTADKSRWYEDGDGFWVALRTKDRATAAQLSQRMEGKPWAVTAKPESKRRSLDANAYYWVLLSKLAAALHISTATAHNLMLRRYGQLEVMDGQLVYLVVPESEEAEKKALESETYHIKPTAQTRTGNDGVVYRTYLMLKGSHEYNTKEMTVLIEGLVDECHAQGIETKTPDELALMMARWGEQ